MKKANMMKKVIINSGYLLALGIFLLFIIKYVDAVYRLPYAIVTNNPIMMIAMIVFPFFIWFYSTSLDKWNYWNRKLLIFYLCVIQMVLIVIQPIYTWAWMGVSKLIGGMRPGRNFTETMILNLGRILLGGTILLMILIAWNTLYPIVKKPETITFITGFKWKKTFDCRTNKENLYDMKILRNLKTGKWIPIHQEDRKTQMLFLGSSGTGKTSSLFIPAIIADLDRKLKNFLKRMSKLKEMVLAGKAVVRGSEKDEVTEKNVVAVNEKYEKELKEIWKKYADCGTTVIAPNSAMNDDIIRAVKARHMIVNVVDPVNKYNAPFVRQLRINPFYIPYDLDPQRRVEMIVGAASNFAEVVQAVNERFSEGEQYFKDLSNSTTSNIAIVAMLRANMNHRQTNMPEIQSYINETSKLVAVVKEIEDRLRIHIITRGVKINSSRDIDADYIKMPNMDNDNLNHEGFRPLRNINEIPEKYRHMGLKEYNEMLKKEGEYYYPTLLTIHQELISDENGKMFDQLRGLRVLMQKILMEPHVRDLFSGSEENLLDFDEMLSDCEITVINTALELGAQNSTVIGLFCLLNLSIAVKRRPMNERPLHMVWVDEATQYMHPVYEDMVAIWRQFNVQFALAIQSLAQTEKSRMTQYLKNVIMTVGTHIVFGRVGAEEMKIYEAMGGAKQVETIQKQVSSNSIMEDTPSRTEGGRSMMEQKSNLTGTDIRNRDFQEVSVFTVKDGNVMDGMLAKAFFAKESDFAEKKFSTVNWKLLLPKEHGAILKPVHEIEEEAVKITRTLEKSRIEEHQSSLTISEIHHVPEEDLKIKAIEQTKAAVSRQTKEILREGKMQQGTGIEAKEKEKTGIEEIGNMNLYDLLFALQESGDREEERTDEYAKMLEEKKKLNSINREN